MRGLSAIHCFMCVIICVIFPSLVIAGGEPIGSIKTVEGQAYVVREGDAIPATVGARIFKNDTLKTSEGGALGAVFRDNTTISLGPRTEVVLDEFIFAPDQAKFSMITRMIKGSAAYLSGLISKLSPGSARVETPVGVVGFRGTKCLISIAGGQ